MIKLMVLRNLKLKTLCLEGIIPRQKLLIHFPLKKLCKNCIILINRWLKLVGYSPLNYRQMQHILWTNLTIHNTIFNEY